MSGFVKILLLPPAGLLWIGLIGFGLLATPRADLGLSLLAGSWTISCLLGTPLIAKALLRHLDRFPPLDLDAALPAADALIILDAGRRAHALEYGGDNVKPLTLERLRFAAWFYRHHEVPLLVSGNGAGELMATVLAESFGVPVRWVEPNSRTTHESAELSARLLRHSGIERAYLLTHFWHMPRAVAAFRHAGLEVIPTPMGFSARDGTEQGIMAWVPRTTSLHDSYLAIHEIIGLLWYRIRFRHGAP